jgi:hypothetical protein
MLVGSAALGNQDPLNLPDEPVREGEAVADALQAVLQGGDVAGHLYDVVHRDAWHLVQLEEKQVRERGLRALDLRGEDGLLADVRIEEELSIGKQCGDAVEAAQRQERFVERLAQVGVVR